MIAWFKGEGEETFLQLCKRISDKKEFRDLLGITVCDDQRIIDNPMQDSWLDMDSLPFPRYDLLDMRRYADYEEGISYETSRGCPFRCAFCYVEYFHHRKWRAKSIKKVTAELSRIKKELGAGKLVFVDDNFFAHKKRSLDICQHMKADGLHMQWTATARADFLSGCSQKEMDIIKESHCEILSIGAESGSTHVLSEVQKDITPQQVKDAVKKCVLNAIMPTVSFMIGFPFETDVDVESTLRLYDELMAMGPQVEINGLFIYVPYAGTTLFEGALKYGYQPKARLEDWAQWNFSDTQNNPWLTQSQRRTCEVLSTIARFKYLYHRFEYYSQEFRDKKLSNPAVRLLYRVCIKPFAFVINWRWRKRFFLFPIEVRLWRKIIYIFFKIK